MDCSLKLRGGNRCLAPIYEEKSQHRHRLLQKKECSDETEATVSETEFEEEEEEEDQCSSSAEEQYFCNNVCGDDETHPFDECTMFEEYTIEEYTIDDGGNMTCGDDYTFVTIHEDDEEEEVKTVRFSATTTTTYIMPLSEFTSKERTNYWISAKEKEKYERRLARTLAKLLAKESAGDFSKQDEEEDGGFPSSTHRGLENFTIQGNSKVTKQIHLILNSVMDEQDRQWNEGSEGVENGLLIAAISQDISKPDIDHAIQKAQNDEEEAIGVYIKGSFYRDYRNVVFCSDDNESSADNTLLSCRVRTARKASKKQRRSSSATSNNSKEAAEQN